MTTKSLASIAVMGAALVNANAQSIVYDTMGSFTPNLTPLQTSSFGQSRQIGNEVLLSGGDTSLTSLTFGFYANNLTGSEVATLNLYYNEVGNTTPNATAFYTDFGTFFDPSTMNNDGTDVQSLIFDFSHLGGSLAVPGHFTWTLTFSGLAEDSYAGLFMTDAGYSVGGGFFDGAWENENGAWQWRGPQGGQIAPLFLAQIQAVPEPSTIALLSLGGLALIGLRRRLN